MLMTRNDMICGVPGAETSDRRPTTSRVRNGWARGNRVRRLSGSPGWTWSAHLKASVAAAVLAVPCLVLPAAPAGAACETSEGLDHGETRYPCASWKEEKWRSGKAGDPAGIADIEAGRWRDLLWDGFTLVADDVGTRIGSQGKTDRDPLLGGLFLSAAGDPAAPGDRRPDWGQAPPLRFTGAHGDGLISLFGADCERGRLVAGVTLSHGAGEGGHSGAGRHGLGDSLSALHPYARVAPTERLSSWNDLGCDARSRRNPDRAGAESSTTYVKKVALSRGAD